MALEYSKTKFGTTFSSAYVKATQLSINFGRTETYCVAKYSIAPNSTSSEVMEYGQVSFQLDDMSVTTPEQQLYNYLTGSVSEFSSATNA